MKFWHDVFHLKMETKDSWFGVAFTLYILSFLSATFALGLLSVSAWFLLLLLASALFLRMGIIAGARSN